MSFSLFVLGGGRGGRVSLHRWHFLQIGSNHSVPSIVPQASSPYRAFGHLCADIPFLSSREVMPRVLGFRFGEPFFSDAEGSWKKHGSGYSIWHLKVELS